MPGCNHCPSEAPVADSRFRRVLWLALAVNAVMFVVEVIASWLSGSLALQADALDFLGDSFNYAISLVVLPMGLATRAKAALLKGVCMAAFGVWVLAYAGYRVTNGLTPDAVVMGVMGFVALAANVSVAALLYSYRAGDANMRSVWLCSRNDAVANVAVIIAAAGVFTTASQWPDLLVAAVIAGLALHAAVDVIRQARMEIRQGASLETPRFPHSAAIPGGED